MRLQRMLLNLQWYDLYVIYRAGKHLKLPDTLSRAHLPNQVPEIPKLHTIRSIDSLAVNEEKYEEKWKKKIRKKLEPLRDIILKGWPDDKNQPNTSCLGLAHGTHSVGWCDLQRHAHSDTSHSSGTHAKTHPRITHGNCKVQTARKRSHVLASHQCRNWRNSEQLSQMCYILESIHSRTSKAHKNSWLSVCWGVNRHIWVWRGKNCLFLVDYYSKFIEVNELKNLTSSCVIDKLKKKTKKKKPQQQQQKTKNSSIVMGLLKKNQKWLRISVHQQRFHTVLQWIWNRTQQAQPLFSQLKRWRRTWCTDSTTTMAEEHRQTSCSAEWRNNTFGRSQSFSSTTTKRTSPQKQTTSVPQPPKFISSDKENTRKHLNKLKEKQKLYHDRPHLNNHAPFQSGDEVRMTPLPGTKEWQPAVEDRA